jgi:hypothetical protein
VKLWNRFSSGIKIRSGGANETVPISVFDWAKAFAPGSQVNFNGQNYQAFKTTSSAQGLSSIVYTCERLRVGVFSEARFVWQRMRDGRPQLGSVFGTKGLSILETPWKGATTRDLLAVCEMDCATHGISAWIIDDDSSESYLARIEPDSVKILTSAVYDGVTGNRVGERLAGYAVTTDRKVTIYSPDDIAVYRPMPASSSQWNGQSWISACLPDIDADAQLTEHKRATIRNGANLTHLVNLDGGLTPKQFDDFVDKFNEDHMGPSQAGKTLFIQGATDVKTVGQTFESLSLRATQGSTETRIAAAAGTHPVILGLSEGLAGSSLNAGNYNAAKRNFVDGTMCPLWGGAASAFWPMLKRFAPGPDVRLWYDAQDIPFLREDTADMASVLAKKAMIVSSLITSGYDPDAVISAVANNDLASLTGAHSGLFSVQLRTPGQNDSLLNDSLPNDVTEGSDNASNA